MLATINGKRINTWSDDNVLICPYCGEEIFIDDETFMDSDLETNETFECPHCGEEFTGTRQVCFFYETYKNNSDGTPNWEDDQI